MGRIDFRRSSIVAADRNIGVTGNGSHRDLHRNRVNRTENQRIGETICISDQKNRKRSRRNIDIGTAVIFHRDLIFKIENRSRIGKQICQAGFILEHALIIGRQDGTLNFAVEQCEQFRRIVRELLIIDLDAFGTDLILSEFGGIGSGRIAYSFPIQLAHISDFLRSRFTVNHQGS